MSFQVNNNPFKFVNVWLFHFESIILQSYIAHMFGTRTGSCHVLWLLKLDTHSYFVSFDMVHNPPDFCQGPELHRGCEHSERQCHYRTLLHDSGRSQSRRGRCHHQGAGGSRRCVAAGALCWQVWHACNILTDSKVTSYFMCFYGGLPCLNI